MILVCGIPSETPVELLVSELDYIGADYLLWNQRKFRETTLSYSIDERGRITGTLGYQGTTYRLEDFTAIYSRITDWTTLPEIEAAGDDQQLRDHCDYLHQLLQQFMDNCAAVVVNPTEAMMGNNSKPYQMFQAREAGIPIPDTLVTTGQAAVLDFYEAHDRRIIYKSASGTRSIVRQLEAADMGRLRKVASCPTQFQQFIDGDNVRVHVISDKVIATGIRSSATDYRYAGKEGGAAELHHVVLKAANNASCIRFGKMLGLFFSGLDFKQDAVEKLTCFEANPMPGYSYYEQSTSQPIAYTLACELQQIDAAYKARLSSREIMTGMPS